MRNYHGTPLGIGNTHPDAHTQRELERLWASVSAIDSWAINSSHAFQNLTLGNIPDSSSTPITSVTPPAALIAHTLLNSTAHSDTATQSPSAGSLVYGNTAPLWDELVIGTAAQLLQVNAGATAPAWVTLSADATLAAGGTLTLATVNTITPGTFGSATTSAVVTVNAKGLVTASSEVVISGVAPSAHNILSASHGDTLAAAAVLGDIIHGNATPKWARLAGDTSNTRKFLRSLSSAGVATIPAWDTLAVGDLPTLTDVTTNDVSTSAHGYAQKALAPAANILNVFSIINGETVPTWRAALASPSVSIGLTANNGTAITGMRSDATPALSVAIAPTWTGVHTHNPSTTPGDVIILTIAAIGSAGQRNSHNLAFVARSDDGSDHQAQWRTYVDPYTNAGASVFKFDSKLDSGTQTTRAAITDLGGIDLHGTFASTAIVSVLAPASSFTAYNFNLPTTAGTAGQPLLSGGGGAAAQTYGTLAVAAGGTNKTSWTAGSVAFAGAGGTALAEDNANLFWDDANNFLGLGTAVPLGQIHSSVAASSNSWFMDAYGNGGFNVQIGRVAGGSFASPAATTINSALWAMGGRGHDGTSFVTGSRVLISLVTQELWTATAQGTYISFTTTPSGSTTRAERARITGEGLLGIGTTAPTNILSLGGNSVRTIWMERHTTAATAGNLLTLEAGGCVVGGTDLAGGELRLSSGLSTGSGTSFITLYTAPGTAAATTTNTSLERVRIHGNGFVHLSSGALAPTQQLCVSPLSGTGGTSISLNAYGGNSSFVLRNSAGTETAQTATVAGAMGRLGVQGHNATSIANSFKAMLEFGSEETWTGSTNATYIDFYTTPTTTTSRVNRLRIAGSGNVGIGTTSPGNLLDVNGTVNIVGITTLGAPATLKGYTVATLPAGVQGHVAFVTDALAPTFLAAAVGGGAIVSPVFYNGAAWVSF